MSAKVLLRGGCVLTLGHRTANFTTGDVLIEDDRIAAVGQSLRARDAEVIDATDAIVMPGFVDTHRHAWTALFRHAGERVDSTAAAAALAAHLEPDDAYVATLIGLLSAAEAGITTVADWSDIPLTDAGIDAVLRAHADAGVRSVFVRAPGASPDGADQVRALAARLGGDPAARTSFAVGATRIAPDDAAWELARSLGLRIHAHAGAGAPEHGSVAAAHERGGLGPDVTLVHHATMLAADLDAVAASGTAISLAPTSEMAEGQGTPPIQELIGRDIRPGLGSDRERLAPGDAFAQMRATISLQHATVFDRKLMGKASLPKLMSTRDVIKFATADGARVAGVDAVTGSLEPGKQADVVVLRTDRPNIFPINDPIGAVVWGMDTSNVAHVFVAGRALVRDGVLDADVADVRARATRARDRVMAAAGIDTDANRGAA
jgi:cytosine/adenosine deaminase-related metal-dependent hydrolase